MGPGGCYGGSCVIRSEIKDAEAAVAIHPEGWAVVIADFEGIDTLPFVLPSPFPTPPHLLVLVSPRCVRSLTNPMKYP